MVKPTKKNIDKALSVLTKKQRRRLKKYSSGKSVSLIAKQEKVSKAAVYESILRAKRHFQKTYGNNIAFVTDV